MDDLISRQALMKEFSDFVRASNNSDFARTPTWNDAVSLVESMPSAQPERTDCTECEDYDSERHYCPKYCEVIQKTLEESQPEIDEILNYLDTELHPLVSPERWDVYATLYDMISLLHKQPERETGTWIIDSGYPQHCWCSNCNHRFDLFDPKSIHFCPNCGKEMKTCVWKSQDERRQE